MIDQDCKGCKQLRVALQSLVNAVANMRVPQTIEDAALQVFQIGPVLRHAQHVLECIKE